MGRSIIMEKLTKKKTFVDFKIEKFSKKKNLANIMVLKKDCRL